MDIDANRLHERLNPACVNAFQQGFGLCMTRTHFSFTPEHWLIHLIAIENGDIGLLLKFFELDPADLARAVAQRLSRLNTGNGNPPQVLGDVILWMKQSWLAGSLLFRGNRVRSGHLLYALLEDETLRASAVQMWPAFAKIDRAEFRKSFADVVAGSSEAHAAVGEAGGDGEAGGEGGADRPLADDSALRRFTIDLCAEAKAGRLSPVRGRDVEIQQMVKILLKQTANNPIILGDPGVGKTAVVEGLAQAIVAGTIDGLKDVSLLSLDLTRLQAGASIKGEFENRLKGIVDEVKSSPKPIILFVDEAHTLVGAGGKEGTGDAANILKPALSRGQIRMIGATTWREYQQYFVQDPALQRRFVDVKIKEPDDAGAFDMLQGLIPVLEKHHSVRILDEAVRSAIELSRRYIPSRKLPDKARGLLDTACVEVRLAGGGAKPDALFHAERRCESTALRITMLERENRVTGTGQDAIDAATAELAKAEQERDALTERWQRCRDIVDRIRGIQTTLGQTEASAQAAMLREERERLLGELEKERGEQQMMPIDVDAPSVAHVVASWTGIPAGKMQASEMKDLLNLSDFMKRNVVGQDPALDEISGVIQTARLGFGTPTRPLAVMLFLGTSGIGKTETAKALAEFLFGTPDAMIVFNMSEYQSEGSVQQLLGAPPGFVGFDQGGALTEAVRQRPYSIVLLDEFEKTERSIKNAFFRAFDEGKIRDGAGEEFDLRNCVFVLTSNAGSDELLEMWKDPATRPPRKGLVDALRKHLGKHFDAALLGRMDRLVIFEPLDAGAIRGIVEKNLRGLTARAGSAMKTKVTYGKEVIDHFASRAFDPSLGARNVRQAIENDVTVKLSRVALAALSESRQPEEIRIVLGADGGVGVEEVRTTAEVGAS